MNKKTFALAVLFFCATLAWFLLILYWRFVAGHYVNTFDLVVSVLCVIAGSGMVYHEFRKKKRRHLDEVNKHKIP